MSKSSQKIGFIVPTYRRPKELQLCLEHLNRLIRPDDFEMAAVVYDNGSPQDSEAVVTSQNGPMSIRYVLNEPGHGLGYSLVRGATETDADIIVELNDDALVPEDFAIRICEIFGSNPSIGVLGFRAIESGYFSDSRPCGVIDTQTCEVVGNFNRETDGLVDVEHVYGFCYAYRSEVLKRGGVHDKVLLSKDYSSGSRIETDHCLSCTALGFRIAYDGTLAVTHLAKPRGDMDERSLRWKGNHWRNTLYLYLKHFGWFGRRAIALRFALKDVGIISFLKRPNRTNRQYLLTGFRARASAVWHWFKFKSMPRVWIPLKETERV